MLIKAFSRRELAAEGDTFGTNVHLNILEDGVDDLSHGVSMVGTFKVGDAASNMSLTLHFTPKAEAHTLKSKIEEFHDATFQGENGPPLNKTVSVVGQEVLYKIDLPAHTEEEEEDLKASFQAHKPQFIETLAMGNDFETMLNQKSENIVKVVNGLKVSTNFTIASTIFEVLRDSGKVPPPAVDLLEGLASETLNNTIRYRTSLKECHTIPTLEKEMKQLAENFKHAPQEIRDKIGPVMEASTGLTRIEMRGFPYNWEMDVVFENFKPFTLMKQLLEM